MAIGVVFTTMHFPWNLHWTQKVGVLHYATLEWLIRHKRSSFMGPFVKLKCCEYAPLGLYLQQFIFFVTYKWSQ